MIVGIDPGGTTGLAFRLDADNGPHVYATVEVPGYNIESVVGALTQRAAKIEVVVIESFLGIQYRGGHGIETLEMIGAVRGICAFLKIPVVKQAPAMRKPFERLAKERLQKRKTELGIGYSDHEVSALAHLLRWEHAVERAEGKQIAKQQRASTS